MNANPYDTRGEEILTRYEDDYKFHRYTNRYGNAFGSEYYTIRITCRSILTDPEIYQRLHDTHYEKHSRYYGYLYGQDIYAYDSQYEASKTNALVEATMAGSWLCFGALLSGLILMIIQRYVLRREAEEVERMSVHSNMMGNNSLARGSTLGGSVAGYPRNGSLISGGGSHFQRGSSLRGSDRSIKSHRRDIDDIALSMHHMGGSQHHLAGPQGYAQGGMPPPAGYGRKDIDDMVRKKYFRRNNSLQLEVEQPHGIMVLNHNSGDGILLQGAQVNKYKDLLCVVFINTLHKTSLHHCTIKYIDIFFFFETYNTFN